MFVNRRRLEEVSEALRNHTDRTELRLETQLRAYEKKHRELERRFRSLLDHLGLEEERVESGIRLVRKDGDGPT